MRPSLSIVLAVIVTVATAAPLQLQPRDDCPPCAQIRPGGRGPELIGGGCC
ncbi:hypothetical protein TUN199_03334 [Pyrenophora tritici-repentis]|uniref:Uncharacterized protein n=1 Tax=Pyrenophora tritici-repentis TaxID=45151 RepID=A0A5M9KX52_9PLEO|nr:hypothetical protein PtrV1_12106 [Pyrenophora tritici-repentis]KAF7564433.1 hypothetical protein PtrM4_038670 [Pyrenophora tritici-repentis]KAI0572529.1 hypothetical protein Alg215_09735 [Pyrenophora tritici-repentis]KAI0583555.1 hypothetical protein Alg130_05616 [Pyrenophora tritici-repentis]KAI0613476.1 hypothetical protein TUN205_02281 [Pyrenophora tritici-repentis]